MFEYSGISKDHEAIFIDFENNDFYFLVKNIDVLNNNLSISYWYQKDEYTLATIHVVPQEMREQARSFIAAVDAYAIFTNPQFMNEFQQYEEELKEQAAGASVNEEPDEGRSYTP